MFNLPSFHNGKILILLTIFVTNNIYAFQTKTNNKATIIQLSLKQFNKLQSKNNGPVYVVKNDNSSPEKKVQKFLIENEKEDQEPDYPTSDSGSGVFDFNSGGGGGGDTAALALVVFAVVGTVILIAWIPYFPTFLYGAISGNKDYDYISMLTLNYLGLLGIAKQDDNESRKGTMYGLRYSFILKKKNKKNFFQKSLGISAEFGRYKFEDRNDTTGESYKYDGQYWLVGPSIILGAGTGDNYTYFFKTDFMAGATFDHKVGMALRGDLTANMIVDEYFFIGVGFGALYLNGKKSEGIVRHINDLAIHLVGNFGFFF